MTPWLKFVIAFIVFCHGFVYLRIGSLLPAPVPAWRGSSWLLGDAVSGETLRMFVVTVHVLAGVATLACAFTIGFASFVPGWWRPLALASGLLGIAAFTIFWDGQTKLLLEEGILGAVLSAGLLAMATLLPSAFR